MLHYRNNLGGSYKFVITSNYTCIYTSEMKRLQSDRQRFSFGHMIRCVERVC